MKAVSVLYRCRHEKEAGGHAEKKDARGHCVAQIERAFLPRELWTKRFSRPCFKLATAMEPFALLLSND